MSRTVFIGCGAGFSGDRFDAAGPVVSQLANCEGPRYLIFEVLAERTLAMAQQLRRNNPEQGYSPYLDRYLAPLLGTLQQNQVRIVTNLGSANPRAAARRIHQLTREQGVPPLRIAIVEGDDLRGVLNDTEIRGLPTMEGNEIGNGPLLAANVYLGAQPINDALDTGADIVLVGRTVDSALVLGPLLHEFGWTATDLDKLAAGTICGHLLECGAQVSGAYFADPGFKDVPDLANVGFPIAEVDESGGMVITKPPATGGIISTATVTEQLLYELHDPAAYLVPDVTADITQLRLHADGPNRIGVSGGRGHAPPRQLKATVCVENGWLGEAEMSYAGPNALARAELAGAVVQERLQLHGLDESLRVDVIGAASVLRGGKEACADRPLPFDADCRVRVCLTSQTREPAQRVVDELQALYCSGPAAGGGFRGQVSEQLATVSVLLDRELIEPQVRVEVVEP